MLLATATLGGVLTAVGLSVAVVVLTWLLLFLLVRSTDRMSFFDWWCWSGAVKCVCELLVVCVAALFNGGDN